MNLEMEKYYATNKLFLSRIGSWPYQRKIMKILIPCVLTMVHYSTVVTQVMHRNNYAYYVLIILDSNAKVSVNNQLRNIYY